LHFYNTKEGVKTKNKISLFRCISMQFGGLGGQNMVKADNTGLITELLKGTVLAVQIVLLCR
jgi:hypothetical protein